MITYNWKYEGYPGDSFVVFELFEQNNSTKLRLTHNVQESFPQNVPEFSREMCVEGWTFFIKESLKEYLAGMIHILHHQNQKPEVRRQSSFCLSVESPLDKFKVNQSLKTSSIQLVA